MVRRVRDRGVPRDACNNRSAASCTHPVTPHNTKRTLTAIVSCVHLGYTTGAHLPRILKEPWRKRGCDRGRTFFDVESSRVDSFHIVDSGLSTRARFARFARFANVRGKTIKDLRER